MQTFKLQSNFTPCGSQPKAIKELTNGLLQKCKSQILLGITGSGKTFTIANVIDKINKPTLILAHNKTLAAQLFQEFKEFFPENAVEYFVSYYDYFQPEVYIPRSDTYIEKDMAINDQIDQMRLRATRSLLERRDVIIVASISCIYGLGMPAFFKEMNITLQKDTAINYKKFIEQLVEMQYKRSEELSRGTFRIRGDVIEICPAYENKIAIRIELFDNEIEQICEIDLSTKQVIQRLNKTTIYPASHHVMPEATQKKALTTIKKELKEQINFFEKNKKFIEMQRIEEKTLYDLECIKERGFCKSIENYSRHFDQRNPGLPPSCLLDYFPNDYLLIVDESHQSLPQARAMQRGDNARKKSLIDFGFRLPSAYDNRPLTFTEFQSKINQVIYVSATPGEWEINQSNNKITEQIIRPTGLLDPKIEIRPAKTQIEDSLKEIKKTIQKGGRILVTTLTKKLAEDLTTFLDDLNIKARYLHSDINTIERTEIIRELRLGEFNTLVGINLLREGLDIPEVALVLILDADKEGFLRSQTSLIQTCGRAARNINGKVIMYGDSTTQSMAQTIATTNKRRKIQQEYNIKHNITPQTIKRKVNKQMHLPTKPMDEILIKPQNIQSLPQEQIKQKIEEYKIAMLKAAENLQFEEAARFRDIMKEYQFAAQVVRKDHSK